ncbi:MAG TPA: orotate phosphoribosyltransferase [Thermodesulfobacteriota bacterium]|nr:orotate phosphoribosyltransferase [Thermodesulfobacteriota bacterium]
MASEKRDRLKRILLENSILRGKFTLASGRESDYYIDARLTTLHPEGVSLVADIFLSEIKLDPLIVTVGGPTMGADPIVGALLSTSQREDYPLRGFLVRKQEKGHGTGKLMEGNLKPGDNTAVVEDVVTSGGSVLTAIDAVRNAGAVVRKVLVIVDREEGARQKLGELGIDFYSIFTISELLGD